MTVVRRFGASALALAFILSPAAALANRVHSVAYRMTLPNGKRATVYTDGVAEIVSKDGRSMERRVLRPAPEYDGQSLRNRVPDKLDAIGQLLVPPPEHPYAKGRIIVVYRDGITASRDVVTANTRTLHASVPAYTNDLAVNRAFASIGVDRSERLFRQFNRSVLAAMRTNAMSIGGAPPLDIANAYRLHITGASVPKAVAALAKLPAVAYVEPDWSASPMHAQGVPVQPKMAQAARERDRAMIGRPLEQHAVESNLPGNYALTSSAQSLLNAPGTDAAAAYDEIGARYHQIPGEGETITNVSIGDLDDASAGSNGSDPCNMDVSFYGPTTIVEGGQRYLDLPSMPLIPTFTADASGDLNPIGEVCGTDPSISEIGLDFSMMAPLPHAMQRPNEQGSGLTDLLGIAPGANYRLVVPGTSSPTDSDIDAALLGAALQTPRPNVITASIGIGLDQYGFPSRYLEEDPLSEAIVASIVNGYHIVVCIASGDGTRTYTNVAIGPSGGSAATNLVPDGGTPTSLNDDYLSTIPGEVFDSGSIDVGGTTLDDLVANPPQYATSPQVVAQHAYAETRWTGFTNFSSGFGTRVDVSAPSDNVLSFAHSGPNADSVIVALQGGTSASAPETAAAAAVLLQVARLSGHPLAGPSAVRKLLEQTAVPVPAVTQADATLAVGPQIDLRAAVQALLAQAGLHATPNVARVAVEQRRDYSMLDGAFLSDTDPANISLNSDPTTHLPDELSWITIAPDWEFLPKGVTYRLYIKNHPHTPIAQTPWARVLPATLFAAAGLPLPSGTQTLHLVYQALSGSRVVASAEIPLTFGTAVNALFGALAPQVPAVVTGKTIPVTYDLSHVVTNNPQLVVSEPGRVNPVTGNIFHPPYTAPLASLKGTVNVPVAALQGGGIYGIGIEIDSVNQIYSDFAYTRIASGTVASASGAAGRPPAPLLSSGSSSGSASSPPGHILDIPYNGTFQVQYDASGVSGATGAMLEISAAGPGAYSIDNPFNNPNGTIEDDNGVDTGSVYYVPLSGVKGTVTLNGVKAGLDATLEHDVRVAPLRFGQHIGEASDVSTIAMDGVVPAGGGTIGGGYGINANGFDGFLTSVAPTASGGTVSSLQAFDQTTNLVTSTFASNPNGSYFTYGWPVYGGDVGLVATGNNSYGLINPVASGTMGAAWNPGFPSTFYIQGAASNSATHVGLFLGYDQVSNGYDVFTSDLVAGTVSPLYNVSSQFTFGFPFFTAIGENTTTNTAVLPVYNTAQPATQMVLVNLATGGVSTFGGVGQGFVQSIAVDSATNKAAVTTDDGGMTIYNLATQNGNETMISGGGQFIASDSKNGLFLVQQVQAPTFDSDNNSLSHVLVYDENGNLVETIGGLNLWSSLVEEQMDTFQINPSTRMGYFVGPFYEELEPFKY